MTMHTTDGPSGPYDDPPTMPLRQISDDQVMPGTGQPTVQLGQQVPSPRLPYAPVPPPPVPPAVAPPAEAAKPASTARNGMIMALGSLTSRALGFVRAGVITAALGTGFIADGYAVATMLPNTIFIMLIGGVLNSVFVPELVRAAQQHADKGVAYTNRLLTVCGVVLVTITAVAFFCAPLIVDSYTPYGPGDTVQRDLTIALARYCLPAILFYGFFGLLGQVLNSRDRFGAMMWAPVLNNVVVIAVFSLYLAIFVHAKDAGDVSDGATMLLGLGSAFGILVQALALVPSLRASGFRYRPRFDWRGSGLTTPLRAAGWALLLVVVTQLAFMAITNLATGAASLAKHDGLTQGLGYTPYNNAYLLFIVPQGIITVSLVTAILPSMSRSVTAGRFEDVGRELAHTLRSSAGMIVPASAIFLSLAGPIAALAYQHGPGVTDADIDVVTQILMAFALGLPAFCAQYALARGFYAMSDAKTPFWLTTITSGSNVLLSWAAYLVLPSRWIIVGMAGAHTVAVLISAAITGRALGRRLRKEGAATAAPLPADATLELGTGHRPRVRSGLDGGRLVALHLTLALACAPGALAAYWLTGKLDSALGGGMPAALAALAAGPLAVLVSVLLLARPLGAGAAVAPLARKLRIPYPEPAVGGGKHRR
ncbi:MULTISPECIES: murein biosynthesis integral membrane protein MurJ [unclassified Kitasatospora]|uniref:murein biosynthesis integral membrane protein MurJ n=1 Tax=unclassified Kitasatospora TaxID=2633591 RepID=UPI000B2A0401|nr:MULTISPECIES: murein biosynthesis integral membrane protein MurJ [unclassified Kitasatospora]